MNIVDYLSECEDLLSPGISACQGCMSELALRNILKVFGRKTILTIPPGCMAGAGVGGWNPEYGVAIPSFMPQLGNSAAMLSGVKAAYDMIDPDVKAVAYSGDGATADIGLQALSAAAERKDNIIYICNDNEGYMNTGFQKSGTTPHGASTSTTPVGSTAKGKPNQKKDVAMMLAAQDAAYVATCTPAYMPDFIQKVKRAAEVKDGLVYLHILNVCPTGWGLRPDESIKYAKLAVETRSFLLFEYRDFQYTISQPTLNVKKPKDVAEFLGGQKRFRHLDEAAIEETREFVEKKWHTLSKLAAI